MIKKFLHIIKKVFIRIAKFINKSIEGSARTIQILLLSIATIFSFYMGYTFNSGYGRVLDTVVFVVIGMLLVILIYFVIKLALYIIKKTGTSRLALILTPVIISYLILDNYLIFDEYIIAIVAIIVSFVQLVLGILIYKTLKNKISFIGIIIFIAFLLFDFSIIYYLNFDGKSNPNVVKYINSTDFENGIKSTETISKNPAAIGGYKVQTLTYGSGDDKRRQEYSDGVDIITDTVYAYSFLEKYKGLKAKIRTFYWGFNDKKMPLNAKVWYPEGSGEFPLVIIAHGNHAMEESSEDGYAYLGELLASRGYIVASIDENFLNGTWSGDLGGENDARAWMILKHIEQFEKFNNDRENPFYSKVDLDNIALIGHSRGGEAVALASVFNTLEYYPLGANVKFNFNYNIKTVIALAPTDGQYKPANKDLTLKDVNYLVLHGSNDGDVSNFMGNNVYDRVEFTEENNFFKSYLYIWGANHGQFNTVWGNEDMSIPKNSLINKESLISGEEQREIAKVYISSFLDATIKEKRELVDMFNDYRYAINYLPKTMYFNRFEDSTYIPIANYEEDIRLETATIPESRIKGNLLSNWMERSLRFKDGDVRENNAALIKWRGQSASYSIELSEESILNLKLNSHNKLVFSAGDYDKDEEEYELVDFTISITDFNGEVATVSFREDCFMNPIFKANITKLESYDNKKYGDDMEPILQTYIIDFSKFQEKNRNIDFEKISKIEFLFDKTSYGYIAIDDIGVMK